MFEEKTAAKRRNVGNADPVFEKPEVITVLQKRRTALIIGGVEGIRVVGRLDIIEDGIGEDDVGRKKIDELRDERGGGRRRRGRDGEEGVKTGKGIGLVFGAFAVDDGHVGLKRREVLRPAGLATG